MKNNNLLLTYLLSLPVVKATQLFPLYGAPPELHEVYAQDKFTCFDKSKTIGLLDVNDDYCDCPDGSDEPGTSACDFTFYCHNKGYKPAKILSSRVNDGICDPECCDGTDEYDGKVNCPDICEQVHLNETKKLKEKQKLIQSGLSVKSKYIAQFKTWKSETELKLKDVQAKFDELDKKFEDLKAVKEEKEKLEEQLNKQDEATRQSNRIIKLENKISTLESIIEEQKKNIDHLLEVLKDLKEHHNQNYHDMAVKGAITSYDQFKDTYNPVDIYTDPRLTTDSSYEATPSSDGDTDDNASKIRQDASNARTNYWNLDSERGQVKNELDDLNNKMNRDMGPEGEYSALSDKCFELDNGEYVYSVCMFGAANQKSNKNGDSVSLGTFSEWVGSDYSAQLYSNGTPCWNGPSRSVKLNLSCGTEEKIISVSEPSKCEYHFGMLTPAACSPLVEADSGSKSKSKSKSYNEDDEL